MRLTAGEWMSEWLCPEKGVMRHDDDEDQQIIDFKLVIAEPLENRENSHFHR